MRHGPPVARVSLLVLLGVLSAASFFAGLLFGSVHLPASQVAQALAGQPGLAHDIVWQLRLPRTAAAFACGGLLATAGAALQVLLRNPLADPYILGVSGGAAVGALLAMLTGASTLASNLAAVLGAGCAIAVVFGLSFRAGSWSMHRLLLTGVAFSAGCGALITLILALSPAAAVKGMLYWLTGDLSHAEGIASGWVVLVALILLGTVLGNGLNVLALGELKAKSLGLAVLPFQIGIYLAASLLAASALMLGGVIGFVGLIVPHALRLLGIADHRWLLPLGALAGGSFLTLADLLARTLWVPQELPVGALTALVGVPLFLALLARR